MTRPLLLLSLLTSACASALAADAATPTVERSFIRPSAFPSDAPYSPGVLVGDTLYLAGQVDVDPASGKRPVGVEAQTRRALDNIGLILDRAGLGFGHLVSCHVQLVDMDNYQAMNAVYGSYFEAGSYPARTTLEMPALVGDANIEISCIAFADASRTRTVRPDPADIPAAMGPYSPGVVAGDTLYLSGQGGRNPQTGELAGDVVAEAEQTLRNIRFTLEAAGLGFEDAAFVNVYHLGAETRSQVDTAYRELYQAGAAPSRATFQLSRLPGVIHDEITFIASRKPLERLFPEGVEPDDLSSPATLAGDTLYLSSASAPDAGDFAAQFRAVMERQRQRLAEAELDFAHVVNANVYLTDVGDFGAMNELFREYFPENPPARTTVGVRQEGEREGVLVETALIAVR